MNLLIIKTKMCYDEEGYEELKQNIKTKQTLSAQKIITE